MGCRVLVATGPRTRRRLCEVLSRCEVVCVATEGEVRAALGGERFDLTVLGVHFAESTTLQALAAAVGNPNAGAVVCVRGTRFQALGKSTMAAFRHASLALGADEVLDLLAFPDDPQGNRALREALLAFYRAPEKSTSLDLYSDRGKV